MDNTRKLQALEDIAKKLEIKRYKTIEKALISDNPNDIIKASEIINGIKNRSSVNNKTYFIDPLQFNANLGYKDKPFSLSYTTLKRMSKAPIINSIIITRKNQVADFAEPQSDKYSTGFIIRKKNVDKGYKMDKMDQKIASSVTDFILNCGTESSWGQDDFDTFIRKFIDDSLVYDQATFEIIRNRRGKLERFLATDAATFRVASSYFAEDIKNHKSFFNQGFLTSEDFGQKVHGYYPSHVQIYQTAKVNEFYPWELCFGVRNPATAVNSNGYGRSELEDLINVVTGMLWGDEYNRRFFSQGSAPKGFFKVKGGANETALQQFKQQWQAMISGVMQSWKTPLVEAEIDWVDLQKNNRDMEYSSWIEYLIKLSCASYSIDPLEIGWDISRSSGNSSLFGGDMNKRLQHSKDKGLYPLLKFVQRKINKYIIEQINPEYEFVFSGLNGMTISEELDMDIKKAKSFMFINEVREKYDLKPVEHGDIISDSVYAQQIQAERQEKQQAEMRKEMYGNTNENPFEKELGISNGNEGYDDETEKSINHDIFVKAFENFMNKENDNI